MRQFLVSSVFIPVKRIFVSDRPPPPEVLISVCLDEADKLALGKKAGKGGKPGKARVLAESMPTPQAIRVEPRIADDLKVGRHK